MKVFILLLAVVMLGGCTIAAESVKDVNKHIAEITGTDQLTTECVAGFYSGMALNSDNMKIVKATQEMNILVDTTVAEYVRCKVIGLETSILIVSGKEKAESAINKLGKLLGLF